MSTKISKKKFTELVRNLLQKEIEEATTTVSVGDMSYDTPRAFSGKGKDRRNSVASGSGYEKVNEAVLTISYQPIFDADKKDKLEKIAKKSGLAIRSRGKQGFTVDGKRANVEKFIKATRGMIEVKEGGPGSGRPKDGTRGNPDDAWDDEEGRAKPKGKTDADSWDDDEEAKAQAMKDMGIEDDDMFEDTKDIAKAKKLSQKIQQIEGKYRKAMYDLSDRLQADPKNHKLQDELIKSYTKHVTSFMKDMIKITKRVK